MAAPVVVFDHVTKRFAKGAAHDSLRDMLAGLVGRGKSRDAFLALNDVSFEVAKGEAVGIVGPNGSGKSTALKLMTGILLPTSGGVRVDGRIAPLIEVGAGFHPDLTGRENIWLNAAITGMTRGEARACFDDIVAFSGLDEFLDTPVKRYSSGMYMRLGFSIAAHMPAEVLVVDEVLAVGDVGFRTRCLDKMNALKGAGRTILFVSHHSHQVRTLCDRVVYLKHGVKVFDGDPVEGTRRYLDDSMAANAATAPGGRGATDAKSAASGPARIVGGAVTSSSAVTAATMESAEDAGLVVLAPGAPFDATVRYSLRDALEAPPVLSVSLVRQGDGVTAAVLCSRQQGAALPSSAGEHEIAVRWDGVALYPGRYVVEVLLWDAQMVAVLDERAVGTIDVRGTAATLINRPGVVIAQGSFGRRGG